MISEAASDITSCSLRDKIVEMRHSLY